MKRWFSLLLAGLLMVCLLAACGDEALTVASELIAAEESALAAQSASGEEATPAEEEAAPAEETASLAEDAAYTSAEDVALYLHLYGTLPGNFITKDEAHALGWEGGGLEDYAPGMSIGGDHFGNYEGALPEKKGRSYHECDINTMGANSRGAERIVYSNDGLIYYSDDHYETFTLLYGEE